MRTLDKKRPYATVHGGDGERMHAFEQDGLLFDQQGNEVEAGQPAPQPQLVAGTSVQNNLPPQSSATGAIAMIGAANTILAKPANEVLMELGDCSDDMLTVLRELEPAGKNRSTIIAALEDTMAKRAEPAEPATNPDQVSQQLGA
jgi:hypothetical protein